MSTQDNIEIGDVVKDPISGLEGIVICMTEFLTGCKRCSVQKQGLNKDNKPYEPVHFDVPQLTLIRKKGFPAKPTKKGGPRDIVPQKTGVSR